MSYTALYRKYRPSTFNEVAGQKHIVTTLTNALAQNRLAHAYLFSGPSGNGKTSIAKLFAKAINCESDTEIICDKCHNCISTKNGSHPDIIEIDAASNNGVEEIRSLIEKVKYAPLNGKYKVYIIDEVHMLSLGAFNALLKTLEEPPAHIVFILATTEPHKIIPTIISRCQRYDFTRVKEEDIFNNIVSILKQENITYEDDAIKLISTLADGGVRESLSILEQSIAYSGNELKVDDIRRIYGIVTKEEKLQLINLMLEKDMESTLNMLNEISDQGNNLERLNIDLINMLKESVIYGFAPTADLLVNLSETEVKSILDVVSTSQLLEMIDILMEIDSAKKSISDLHAYLELGLIKIINIISLSNLSITNNVNTDSHQNERVQAKTEQKPIINEVKTETIKEEINVETVKEVEPLIEKIVVEEKPNVVKVEEEKVVEEEKEPIEVKPVTINDEIKIDTELLLSLLTHANKDKRIEIESSWPTLQSHGGDVKFAKYVAQLKDSKLIAVGDNYALISVDNNMFANNINSLENQALLSEFILKRINQELRIFAITHENTPKLINDFRVRMANNTLPSKVEVKIIKNEKEVVKIETLEDKATNLFGEGGFIIEEWFNDLS